MATARTRTAGRAAAGATERAGCRGVEQDGLQVVLREVALGLGHERVDEARVGSAAVGLVVGSAVVGSGGVVAQRRGRRDVEDLEDRQRDAVEVAGLLVAVELHGVQAEARGDGRHLAGRSVGEDADEQRSVAGRRRRPGRQRSSAAASCSSSARGVPGTKLRPMASAPAAMAAANPAAP